MGDVNGMRQIMMLWITLVGTCSLACANSKGFDRVLDLEKAGKQQVFVSMTGYRDTLIFYSFADQQTVLKLQIDNQAGNFPIAGTLYFFAPETTADGLAKWINNQHSDALYPDVPKPVSSHQLPADFGRVTERQAVGEQKGDPTGQGRKFQRHDVTFTLDAVKSDDGDFHLSAYEDSTRVYLLVKNP